MARIWIVPVDEAVSRLKAAGIARMNQERLRTGIEQGVYPFGVCVKMGGKKITEIYSALMDKWISERAGGTPVSDKEEVQA